MDSANISRRDFLFYGAAATAAGLAGATAVGEPSQVEVVERPVLRVKLRDPQGRPLDDVRIKTMTVRDMAGDPLPQTIRNLTGESHIRLASEPIQLSCRLVAPGFGEVYCYADNGGQGYTAPGEIDFVVEAARTRLHRVKQKLAGDGQAAKGDGEIVSYLGAAEKQAQTRADRTHAWTDYQSLAAGLRAGEKLSLLCAQQRIARLTAPRRDFYFGCATSGRDRFPGFTKLFTDAFNFGTLSWYIWQQQELPEATQIQYERMDQSLQWCLDHHIVPKGFGYVYLTKGAMPEWLRSWPYEKMLPLYERVVEQTMRRYDGRMPYAEIINEAHDKSNLPRFDHAQILELTREACAAARRGSPNVKRLINNCCMWAEYARNRNQDGSRRWSPYRYLADCVKSNVEFERIGLQLYYPSQDLFEIERMLDRFKDFGRPLHISEISCNSAPGLDPDSMRPKEDVPGWHGPWTETMQADWVEAIYTLCYSKAEFEVVGWWDFADYGGHFWPHGGLLRKDFTPKEAYTRLLSLKKKWGLTA